MDDDLHDMIEWAKNPENLKPSPDWVTIDAERLAIAELERCAEHLEASDPDGYRLLEAIRCLHLSMVAAMTAALSGSASIGALSEKHRIKAIDAMNDGRWDDVPERVMPYASLLDAVQQPGAMEWSQALQLTPTEKEACTNLNKSRERIDHPKQGSFSEVRAHLRAVCRDVSPIVARLMRSVSHHFEDADFSRAEAAIGRIRCAGKV